MKLDASECSLDTMLSVNTYATVHDFISQTIS
jgi:hypothetical protein